MSIMIIIIVGTMGFGPDPPTNRPRMTEAHSTIVQSTGPVTFIYQSDPNILPRPDKRYNA